VKSIFNPKTWFGKSRDRAVAHDLEQGNISKLEYQQAQEDLALKQLSKQANSKQHLEELKLARDLKLDRISHSDYERELATVKGEPYVNVLNMGIDKDNVVQGYIELDWNDEFVKMLTEAGITGTSDEDIVNKWFNGVCRTVLWQEQADLDYGLNNDRGRPDVEYRSEGED